jgi:hypothetical protein
MTLPRWLQPLLLTFVLLFAQQVASLHAMSHALQSQTTQEEQDLPNAKSCSQCIALADIQSALPPRNPPFVSSLAGFITGAFADSSALTPLALGFSARAPPALL